MILSSQGTTPFTARLGFYGLVLCLAFAASKVCAASGVITPGRSIGKVRLGMSRQLVHRLLGKPDNVEHRKDGLVVDWWAFSKPKDNQVDVASHGISIFYGVNKVIQLWTDWPRYATVSGVSLHSTPQIILQKFRKLRRVATYTMVGDFDGPVHVYDNLQSGIGFEIWCAEGKSIYSGYCNGIIIHSPTHPIIPDTNDLVKQY